MAAVSVTTTSVLKGTVSQAADVNVNETLGIRMADTLKTDGGIFLAAVTITRGQLVYKDTSVSPPVLRLAQCDGTAAESVLYGVSLSDVGAGQPCLVQTGGPYTVGGTLTDGMLYCVGAAAGSIVPIIDLASGNYLSIFGWSSSTTVLQMTIVNTQKTLGADIT